MSGLILPAGQRYGERVLEPYNNSGQKGALEVSRQPPAHSRTTLSSDLQLLCPFGSCRLPVTEVLRSRDAQPLWAACATAVLPSGRKSISCYLAWTALISADAHCPPSSYSCEAPAFCLLDNLHALIGGLLSGASEAIPYAGWTSPQPLTAVRVLRLCTSLGTLLISLQFVDVFLVSGSQNKVVLRCNSKFGLEYQFYWCNQWL